MSGKKMEMVKHTLLFIIDQRKFNWYAYMYICIIIYTCL